MTDIKIENVHYFSWENKDKDYVTTLELHNKTMEDAITIATEFGWTEPKWWEIRRKYFSDNDYHLCVW